MASSTQDSQPSTALESATEVSTSRLAPPPSNHHERKCHHHRHHHHHQNILSPHHHHHPQSRHHSNLNKISAHHHDSTNEPNQPNLELHHPSRNHLPIARHYIAIKNNPNNANDVASCECEIGGGGIDLVGGGGTACHNNTSRVGGQSSDDDRSHPSSVLEEVGRRRKARDETRKKLASNRLLEDPHYTNGIEVYSDGADSGVKVTDEGTSEEDQSPPLPPRPQQRIRNSLWDEAAPHPPGVRKYVIWCLICGGTSSLIGVMFLGVYFLLRSYTSSVAYFETVPTFVPATLLMLTGLCIMSLARRRNRYSYLIKLSGACGVASALTCALVTVTTTVLHLSRLQTLRQCEYTQLTRTCTCFTAVLDPKIESTQHDETRFVFDSTADCGIVHGALYSCLRAVFGLSVAGVLVAVFSCMLVYQLLSHERKKMYWEQLELRCRSLYTGQPSGPPPGGPAIIGTPRGGPCRCCEQCHSHRNPLAGSYPWEGDNRFWVPGQAGNFYSPNPVGDEISANPRLMGPPSNQRSRGPGWSWPRMPWQRNESQRFRQTPSSPDSQYGFSNQSAPQEATMMAQQQTGYNVIGGPPYGVWGPPPPYSDPNSPARRGHFQYIHPSQCPPGMTTEQLQNMSSTQPSHTVLECHQHNTSADSHSLEPFCPQPVALQPTLHRANMKRQANFKTKESYEHHTPSDSDGGPRDRFSNTLPVRKIKKRVDAGGAKSIGPNQSAQRVNVQNIVFSSAGTSSHADGSHLGPEISNAGVNIQSSNNSKIRRIKSGVENSGFQAIDCTDGQDSNKLTEPCESEVYFADVSSCCNVSVKNDNFYEDAAVNPRQIRLMKTSAEKDHELKFVKDENEDYLVQRFGKRETSIRSRLPFSQLISDECISYDKGKLNIPNVAPRTSLMHKDISRQSMCSIESGEKTDYTDLSPATPASSGGGLNYPSSSHNAMENYHRDFVASFPYSSNEQSQEAHRRSTKNIQDVLLASTSVSEPSSHFEKNPLALNHYDQQQHLQHPQTTTTPPSGSHHHGHYHLNNKPKSPKNLNITPIKRQNIGSNITALIQNLGGSGNDISGLMYSADNGAETQQQQHQPRMGNRRENDVQFVVESATTTTTTNQDCNLINSNLIASSNLVVSSSGSSSISSSSNNNSSSYSSCPTSTNNKNNNTHHVEDWPSASDLPCTSDRRL